MASHDMVPRLQHAADVDGIATGSAAAFVFTSKGWVAGK